MNKLEARVERLEGATGADMISTIIICPVAADMGKPADPQPETTGARCLTTGEHLPRNPGEDMDAFRERASAWARGRSNGVPVLMLTSEDD